MDKKTNILIGIIIVLVVAVLYLVSARDTHRQIAPQPSAMMKENFMAPHLPVALTDVQKAELKAGAADHQPTNLTFDITGGSFYFTPNEIKVKQGDKVTIIFTNVGGMHNLTFVDFGGIATKTIQGGQSDTIEFTADKKGTFEFYCSVGGGYHRMMGQVGVLLVQ